MRRKYDLKNKRNFMIILVLAILVGGIFSLFVYKYQTASKIEYKVLASSVIQDEKKNYIKVSDEAILKYRWNGNYDLFYQNKKIPLGKKIIVYNEINGSLKLYGEIYEILEDGSISKHDKETILPNTANNKFYKIGDREYLLVDRKIKSSDNNTQAEGYLLIELDKLGNAKLSNNKINVKTIVPTVLLTSKYSFDINNEILNFGKYDIDLKKIIGSTNKYKKPKNEEIDNNDNSAKPSNSSNNINGNNQGSSGVINKGGSTGEIHNSEEIRDKTKMTSIIRVTEGLSQIDVDYVIYDPYNEYRSVYAEIIKDGKLEVIHLSKNDTHILFDGLVPDCEYSISFVYTTVDKDSGEMIKNTFETLNVRTLKPQYAIEVYKVSSVTGTITYKIYLQPNYDIDQINVSLMFDNREASSETGDTSISQVVIKDTLNVMPNSKYIMGSFSVKGYDICQDKNIKLQIDSIVKGNDKITINSGYSFQLGR